MKRARRGRCLSFRSSNQISEVLFDLLCRPHAANQPMLTVDPLVSVTITRSSGFISPFVFLCLCCTDEDQK